MENRYMEKLLWQANSLELLFLLSGTSWQQVDLLQAPWDTLHRLPGLMLRDLFFTLTEYMGSQPIPPTLIKEFRSFSSFSKEHPHSEPPSSIPQDVSQLPHPKGFLGYVAPSDSSTIYSPHAMSFSVDGAQCHWTQRYLDEAGSSQ